MARRPTLQDLAKAAGLGIATVDRVLHNRANVSETARLRVVKAAREIGYALPGAAGRAAREDRAFSVVLHKQGQEFYRRFAQCLQQAAMARRDADITLTVHFAASQSPQDFADAFHRASVGADAIAGSAINHAIVDRCIETIAAGGTPVFTLLNDAARAHSAGHFGLDNFRTGRIAGWMIGALIAPVPGPVGVFVGGNRWHGQVLRESGFRAHLREFVPDAPVLDTRVNLETRQVTYEATLDLLDRHPDLRGLYIAGGGMEGAIAALREARPPGRVKLVVNELTSESRAALIDGYCVLAIATPPEHLCDRLIDAMIAATRPGGAGAPDRHLLDAVLHLPESV